MTSVASHRSADEFSWWLHEPARLERDQREMRADFPEMQWSPSSSGTWEGILSLWPFDRVQPAGLDVLLDSRGLELQIRCGEAYPIVAPSLFPVNPEPEVVERTQHRWHVNGDGSLCLFQDESTWTGRQSLTDLLCKAAGWNIEYALMKAGAIETMTVNGITSDDHLDHLIFDTARTINPAPRHP
ncbi:hypothetical protein [Rhodococcus jostii]|uniref:Uncharacterized protein n=1 Tax=Rhodococcus jostii TaxID=132919 RepID=A0ABU4CSV9_RHOJO|nr:hypothetical protein [Rhodococcus jostii]MDV6286644.1 hypothetical protein [Rhodococcus jostii]